MYSIAAVEFANENDAREALKGLLSHRQRYR